MECHTTKLALLISFDPIDRDNAETTPPPIAPCPIIPANETKGNTTDTAASEIIPSWPAKNISEKVITNIKRTEIIFGVANLNNIDGIEPSRINFILSESCKLILSTL